MPYDWGDDGTPGDWVPEVPDYETSPREGIYAAIDDERERQDLKWGWPNGGLAGTGLFKKVAILMEEAGEVANAALEGDHDNLKTELVQVAAVCVAWLESIEEFGR